MCFVNNNYYDIILYYTIQFKAINPSIDNTNLVNRYFTGNQE